MKKHFTVLCVCVFICICAHAQSPNYVWATSAGGTATEQSRSIAADDLGNVLVTGSFHSPTLTFGTTILTNSGAGTGDIFIVKYDSNGNVIWAKSAGGASNDNGNSIAVDANGNVLVTGSFASPTITFGTTTLTNTNTGSGDIFIVKYNPGGLLLWAKKAGGTSVDESYGITTDAVGNVMITGSFDSPVCTFGTITLTNAGSRDIFIVKYDPTGNAIWAKSAGGNLNDGGNSIAADANGNVLVTGYFRNFITFGTTTLTNAGGADIFIVKYDSLGNVIWATSSGGTSDDYCNSITTDASGSVLITGTYFSPAITFGTATLTNAGTGSYDIFIVKYDPLGSMIWATSEGGISNDYSLGITTDVIGNVLVTGYFNSLSISFGSTILTSAGLQDIFIVKYDSAGNFFWAKSAGGILGDYGNSITTDGTGSILVTGTFESSSITFGITTLTNAGSNTKDIFVLKLDNLTTSIEENILFTETSVFPNPSPGLFNLELRPSEIEKMEFVDIYNVMGEKVFYQPISETSNFQFDLSAQPNGIYFLQINTGQEIINKKLIIHK